MNKSVKLVRLGEVKTASDNRQYYTATFQDPANPFAKETSRNFWQQLNNDGEGVWKGANPTAVKAFVGKTIPGEIISAKVQPYNIIGAGGVEREASTYTTVILGSELAEVVFKAAGHEMIQAEVAFAAEEEELVIA